MTRIQTFCVHLSPVAIWVYVTELEGYCTGSDNEMDFEVIHCSYFIGCLFTVESYVHIEPPHQEKKRQSERFSES